jgi:hypothetical protein
MASGRGVVLIIAKDASIGKHVTPIRRAWGSGFFERFTVFEPVGEMAGFEAEVEARVVLKDHMQKPQ